MIFIKREINKILIASMLGALSVILSLISSYLIPTGPTFGLVIYQIPIFIGGIILGIRYSFLMALIADIGIGLLNPSGRYLPLFILSKLAWALLPACLLHEKKFDFIKLAIIIIISYILASVSNSFALYVYFGRKLFTLSLVFRIAQIIVFSPIMIFLITSIVRNIPNINYLGLKNVYILRKPNDLSLLRNE